MRTKTRTAAHLPDPSVIEGIWLELQRLNIPMKAWWAEPVGEHTGEPEYGMEVDREALQDWEVDGLMFLWDAEHGWTLYDWCTPQVPKQGVTVLDVPGDPFDAPSLAAHLRKVVVGEIDEFRTAVA